MQTSKQQPKSAFTDEQLHLAARLYYMDALPQMEIARRVKVSQSKISRMLSLARERGIVRISVSDYEPRHKGLEADLNRTFGLSSSIVVKSSAGSPPDELRGAIAHFAAPAISTIVDKVSSMAVAGGRTVRQLVQHLKAARKNPSLAVFQTMGNIDSTVGSYDALELGQLLAREWSGSFFMLNTPAFVPDKKTRDTFLAVEPIQRVMQQIKKVDLAIVGVGTLKNSVFIERSVLPNKDLEQLRRRGAVGEICGRFFNNEGNECETPWRDRVLSIGWDDLRRVPQVIGVVAGSDRSAAIAAAIRGGVLKSLIIDESGALALLKAG